MNTDKNVRIWKGKRKKTLGVRGTVKVNVLEGLQAPLG